MFHLCFHYTGLVGMAAVSSVTTNFRHPLQSNGHHTPEPTGQLCHTETMEVVLNANSAGQSPLVKRRETLGLRPNMDSSPFGIELAYKDEADGICSMAPSTSVSATTPLIIEAIEKDSPADKCGVLQVGDRIHAINEWYTANGTIEEARYILRQAIQHAKIELLVEFNVIEPVLPSSGYFMVKLTRRGDNFGIVCRSETNGEKGEPTIISDIRTGSVAHRCGSIQIGDCIFAINNIFLDSYSVEEAMQLLQRSGNTVRLCIAKRGTIDTSSENSITYTVELSRKNQPLGITIGAAKGRANAVVISQIASNGLAERTGALHIGDRILAINGEPLAGKKLNYAIHLLQKSNDMVSLKIERAGPMISPSLGDMPQIAWRPGYDTASSGMHYSSDGNLINGLKMCVNSAALSTIPSDSVSEGGSSGKLETPLKSVDSAVESLEDSEMVNLQQRNVAKSTSKSIGNGRGVSLYHNDRVSTASEPVHVTHTIHSDHTNGAWDSGLSSVIDSAIGAHSIMPTTGAIASGDYCGGACGRSSSSGVVSSPGSSFKGHQKSIATTRNSATSPRTFSRHKIPEDEKEDWIRILEALETVGEEEMLRKLEDCIMGGRIDNNKKRDDHDFNGNYVTSFISAGFENNLANRSCKTYEKPLIPKHETKVNEQILSPEILSTKSMEYSPINPTTAFISSSMSYSSHTSNDGGLLSSAVKRVQESENGTMTGTMGTVSSGQSTIELPPPMFPLLSSSLQGVRPPIALPEPDTDSPIPFITSPNKYGNSSFEPVSPKLNNNFHKKELIHEIFNVTLDKDPETKSFGFSISDGNSINSGVFVNSVIKNSPAEGKIIPMDRILQINGTSIQFLDCDLAVPLLATDRVELLLLRKPINQTSEHDQFSAPSLSSPIPPFRGDF